MKDPAIDKLFNKNVCAWEWMCCRDETGEGQWVAMCCGACVGQNIEDTGNYKYCPFCGKRIKKEED